MSHRKVAALKKEPANPVPVAKPRSGTKEEILQMVQALSEKIQKDPEKSAKILTDWLNRGKTK